MPAASALPTFNVFANNIYMNILTVDFPMLNPHDLARKDNFEKLPKTQNESSGLST